MLIGVELPITQENVTGLDTYNLIKAHDMFFDLFLQKSTIDRMFDYSYYRNQYLICRKEIIRRLAEYEKYSHETRD